MVLNLALTGIVVHKHYSCMGIDDIAIFHQAESCCSDGCEACQDITESFRLEANFLVTPVLMTLPSVLELPFFAPAFDSCLIQDSPATVVYSFKAPPGPFPEESPQALLQTFRC